MHGCTVATRRGLAHVRVLAESFRAAHPDEPFTCLLVDGAPDRSVTAGPVRLVGPPDAGIDDLELRRLALLYDADELCTALRPRLLAHLRAAHPDEVCLFLELGTVVHDRLDEAAELARRHGVVLVPKVLDPLPRDGRVPAEAHLLATGVYHPGVLAVGPGAAGDAFLDWWATRLGHDGTSEDGAAQPWLDLVPTLFDHAIWRDRGVGVGADNAHERDLHRSADGRARAGDGPLRTLHLHDYDPDEPYLLDQRYRRGARILLTEHALLAELVAEADRRLRAAGLARWSEEPYRFGEIAGGPIPDDVRRLVRHAYLDASSLDPPPVLPFGPEGDGPFVDWLNHPEASNGTDTITRMLLHVWRLRPDLQQAFPHPDLAEIEALARWAVTAEDFIESHGHLHAAAATATRSAAARRPLPGLNIIGQLQGEFGLGEAGRLMARAASAAAVPHQIVNVTDKSLRQLDPFVTGGGGSGERPRYAVNLLCMNGDYLPRLLGHLPTSLVEGLYRVGFWFWEVDVPPRGLDAALGLVDEVWVASEFVADLFRPHTDKPVLVAPLAIIPPPPTSLRRTDLGLPDDRVVFVSSFDYMSIPERKNPLGVVAAYRDAFGPDDGAHLLVKSTNGRHRRDMMAEVLHAAQGRPDIEIRDRYHSRAEMNALVQLCDALISLHRAEGFGLLPATAMAAGKPVVATGYSGNLAFMDETDALLVPYELVEVGKGVDVYPSHARWAEPDLDVAARHLRWILDHPANARLLGNRARASVARTHSLEVAGDWIARRVEQIVRERLADEPLEVLVGAR